MRDLRPYVCTHSICNEPNQQYDSLQAWLDHETQRHGTDSKDQTVERIREDHETGTYRMAATAKEQETGSSHPVNHALPAGGRRDCPFCLKADVDVMHVSDHLEDIALFTLPPGPSPDGDSDGGSTNSAHANAGDSNADNPSTGSPNSRSSDSDEDVPNPAIVILSCSVCNVAREGRQLARCTECTSTVDSALYICDRKCSSPACDHARDCPIEGHVSCWRSHLTARHAEEIMKPQKMVTMLTSEVLASSTPVDQRQSSMSMDRYLNELESNDPLEQRDATLQPSETWASSKDLTSGIDLLNTMDRDYGRKPREFACLHCKRDYKYGEEAGCIGWSNQSINGVIRRHFRKHVLLNHTSEAKYLQVQEMSKQNYLPDTDKAKEMWIAAYMKIFDIDDRSTVPSPCKNHSVYLSGQGMTDLFDRLRSFLHLKPTTSNTIVSSS